VAWGANEAEDAREPMMPVGRIAWRAHAGKGFPRRMRGVTLRSGPHAESRMKRVTGIGGIFFKAKDPKALGAWYREHLGLDVGDWGGAIFKWGGEGSEPGMTIWSTFAQDSDKMAPGTASFMLNFRVADLDALLAALRAEGCQVLDETDASSGFGKFGWIIDPEGNKVELWEPPADQ
jgi:predicted enzyme related to lactoylglutathione lyase